MKLYEIYHGNKKYLQPTKASSIKMAKSILSHHKMCDLGDVHVFVSSVDVANDASGVISLMKDGLNEEFARTPMFYGVLSGRRIEVKDANEFILINKAICKRAD